jgi:hypothetical protein
VRLGQPRFCSVVERILVASSFAAKVDEPLYGIFD